MVQAVPNESRLTGVVRSQRPDPERPGFVVLDLSVQACDPGSGPQFSALAPGQDVHVVAREALVSALPTGVQIPVTATVRMAGPGIYIANDLALDPSAGPVVGSSRGGGSTASAAESGLRSALRAGLAPAMKANDTTAVTAIRGALAAIGNAEAVPTAAGPGPASSSVASSSTASSSTAPMGSVGVGAADVPRRDLSEADIETIVANEISELRHSADEVATTHPKQAAELRAQADVLAALAQSS